MVESDGPEAAAVDSTQNETVEGSLGSASTVGVSIPSAELFFGQYLERSAVPDYQNVDRIEV